MYANYNNLENIHCTPRYLRIRSNMTLMNLCLFGEEHYKNKNLFDYHAAMLGGTDVIRSFIEKTI